VETPLTDFKDGDFADPLTEFGGGGDLEDPLTVFGEVDLDEPVGFGFGSVATEKILLARLRTRILFGSR
jgi:hypothetical protein